MVKFGLDDYTTEMLDYTRHHKQVSLHVKREYPTGDPIVPKSKEIQALTEKHKDRLFTKTVHLIDRESHEMRTATDSFLPLDNLEYPERYTGEYHTSASNTSQVTKLRMFFKIEDVDVVLDHSFKSSGSGAANFHSILFFGADGIEDLIEEIIEDDPRKWEEKSIQRPDDEEDEPSDYHVIGIDSVKQPIDITLTKGELLESLVGVEIYDFEMTIDKE